MQIRCAVCGKDIEIHESITVGQHILCPYCGHKFVYGSHEFDNDPLRKCSKCGELYLARHRNCSKCGEPNPFVVQAGDKKGVGEVAQNKEVEFFANMPFSYWVLKVLAYIIVFVGLICVIGGLIGLLDAQFGVVAIVSGLLLFVLLGIWNAVERSEKCLHSIAVKQMPSTSSK